VESAVQALHAAVDDTSLKNVRPCDKQKLIKSLKLRNACGNDGIPNECLRYLPRRQLTYLILSFNHCLLSDFPKILGGRENHKLTEIQQGSKIYI
jgi:hypothetical protein